MYNLLGQETTISSITILRPGKEYKMAYFVFNVNEYTKPEEKNNLEIKMISWSSQPITNIYILGTEKVQWQPSSSCPGNRINFIPCCFI